MLKDFQIAADLTLRFGINCSTEVFCTVSRAFNLSSKDEGDVNLEAFSRFVYKFYMKHFGDKEKVRDAYSALNTEEQWDNAVLAELEKFQENEGKHIQCSKCLFKIIN